MAPIILILAVILLPIAIATCLTYAAYQSYKRRRLHPAHDIERARNVEHTRQNHERGIEMRDLERPERAFTQFQRSRLGRVVSARIAPRARALHGQHGAVDTIGGEGLISVPNGRGHVGSAKEKGRARESLEDRQFQHEEMYGGEWRRGELEQQGMYEYSMKGGVAAPKPVRVVRTFADVPLAGRPAPPPFDAKGTQVADIWDRIEKREYPRKSFDNVELDDSRAWAQVQRPSGLGNAESSWATFTTGGEGGESRYDLSSQAVDTKTEQQAQEAVLKKDAQLNSADKASSYLNSVQQRYAAAKLKAEKTEAEKTEDEDNSTNGEEQAQASDFAITSSDEESESSSDDEDSSDNSLDDDSEEEDSSDDEASSSDDDSETETPTPSHQDPDPDPAPENSRPSPPLQP